MEALGPCGWIRAKQFEKVLQGYVLGTSIRLGRRREDGHEHNPGVDLTFSPPKSSSLEALVHHGYQKKVFKAHDKVVWTTLDRIERTLLQTRNGDIYRASPPDFYFYQR